MLKINQQEPLPQVVVAGMTTPAPVAQQHQTYVCYRTNSLVHRSTAPSTMTPDQGCRRSSILGPFRSFLQLEKRPIATPPLFSEQAGI